MAVVLLRHADAGAPWRPPRDDAERPLSERGRQQAAALVEALAGHALDVVVSSPARRCRETVAPVAASRSLPPIVDPALAEGAGARAVDLLRGLLPVDALVCSHGDVVPAVLNALAGEGTDVTGEWRWPPASAWLLEPLRGRYTRATFLPPPTVG